MKSSLVLAITFILSLAVSARAGEIDFATHIVDLDGRDIPSSQAKDAPPVDLAGLAISALLAEDPHNPQGKDITEKQRRFELAVRIHDQKKISLTSEETTLLKTTIGASFGPLLVGRAIAILDPVKK